MKISYQWLLDYVDVDVLGLDVSKLAEALTLVGLAVELVEERKADFLLDIDVTTNRPDCLNHLGVARELAAQYRLKLNKPDFGAPPNGESLADRFPAEISIEDERLCPRYAGRVITDLVIADSPQWLRRRLESVGQRPINNIVDITNYVLFAVGHPLHAFDYDQLTGREIRVRTAVPGERITTLDGVARELDPTMLAICDSRRPVAVAGVMGGAETEISKSTRTLLLESAYFEPTSVRSTSKKLGLMTEASYRFERGADPDMPVKALNMACRLIEEVGGGKCVSPLMDVYPLPYRPRRITIRQKRIAQVLGVSVPLDEAAEILDKLDFRVRNVTQDSCVCEVPSFRGDVEIEDDVVEEVARHYGYDRIPSDYPPPSVAGRYATTEYHDRRLLEVLLSCGFFEVVNYSFSTPSREELLLRRPVKMVQITNPLSEMGTHLRTTLVPGLIEAVRYNLNHGNRDVRLFEMGSVFLLGTEQDEEKISETKRLAFAVCGSYYSPFWSKSGDPFTFQHLKGVVETLCVRVGLPIEFRKSSEVPFLHPGLSAEVVTSGSGIGLFGALHPKVLESYKFTEPVLVAELSLEQIYGSELPEPRYIEMERFPAVERDLSFLIDRQFEFGKIKKAVQALEIPELREFRLIDLYQGQSLPEDKLSITVRLKFADPSRTLTQNEVNERSERIFTVLKEGFQIQPR